MDTPGILLLTCVVVFTSLAAIYDCRTKKLPNKLTVSAFGAALVFHIIVGAWQGGLGGVGNSLLFALAGFATGFGILFVVWLIGGGGGGDVKYMGALGTWIGAMNTLQVFIVSAVLIAFSTIGLVLWQAVALGVTAAVGRNDAETEQADDEGDREAAPSQKAHRRALPYGVPVAIATWLVLAYPHVKNLLIAG